MEKTSTDAPVELEFINLLRILMDYKDFDNPTLN